jgi:hypothetical protein
MCAGTAGRLRRFTRVLLRRWRSFSGKWFPRVFGSRSMVWSYPDRVGLFGIGRRCKRAICQVERGPGSVVLLAGRAADSRGLSPAERRSRAGGGRRFRWAVGMGERRASRPPRGGGHALIPPPLRPPRRPSPCMVGLARMVRPSAGLGDFFGFSFPRRSLKRRAGSFWGASRTDRRVSGRDAGLNLAGGVAGRPGGSGGEAGVQVPGSVTRALSALGCTFGVWEGRFPGFWDPGHLLPWVAVLGSGGGCVGACFVPLAGRLGNGKLHFPAHAKSV